MFKIITKNCDNPTFWLVCDHRNCGGSAHAPLQASYLLDPKVFTNLQTAFVNESRKLGWQVNLDSQFCPMCAAEMVEAMRTHMEKKRDRERDRDRDRELVTPATDADVAKWDGKLVAIQSAAGKSH